MRQFRQNNDCDVLEELQPIDENRRYDFNFQQITHLPKEIKILPVSGLLAEIHAALIINFINNIRSCRETQLNFSVFIGQHP